MGSKGIKFSFDIKSGEDEIDNLFKRIAPQLNVRFDEDLNAYASQNEVTYELKDISNLDAESIEKEIDSFFKFNFSEIIDVPLYKFSALRKNDKFTILANIHSSIFDYSSIRLFHDLFIDCDNPSFENKLLSKLPNHFTDFKEDSKRQSSSSIGKYIKFYNVSSNNYKTIKISLDNQGLNSFSNQYGCSRFEFLIAIFSLYLSRIDSTEGCIFKTAVPAGNAILKIDYIKDNSFIDHLNEIKRAYALAVEHKTSDIDNFIEGDLSSYSIYDFSDLEGISVKNGEGSALTLNVYGDSSEIIYSSDLFSDMYISHMCENISSLIDNVLDSPIQKSKDLDILSNDERALISSYSKGKTLDVDKDKTLAMSFIENAIKYPDMVAVDDGFNQVSYSELKDSANSIAYDLLNNHGLALGDCVGLMLPRNYHFPELVLALNMIGVAFTPIDPNYPFKRIEHMLNLSESKCIISTRDFEDMPDFNIDLIYIEDLNMDIRKPVECLGTADDLFAIIFTSGTTGLPKGVMVSNKQIKGMAVAFKDTFKTSCGSTVGYFASFSFIASIRLFVCFIFAETVRIFNETEQKDSLLLIKTLKEHEMSDLILPPSIGIPIYENEDIKLKHLILAGAKLNELSNGKSNTHLVNFYGTTEIIMALVKIFDLNVESESSPVGRPVPNTWSYVLDDDGMHVPIGVPGEVCISSDYISPGYYDNPELTAESFVDNPHSTCEDNRRMYRTGDIGFYNFDGEIEIIGRKDDQLSVRAFRIESGEILSIMNNFPEISDVCLDVDYDNLIAYYVSNGDLDIEDVKDALRSELPYYMVPSLFVELDSIPLNPNGKLDKSVLKNKIRESSNILIGDDLIQSVVDGFREVLDCDCVLMDDDFMQLGGNSLSLMKLQLVLNERLGVHLSSAEIMELRTPIMISDYIKYNLDVHSPIKVNYGFEDSCPLSESQLNVYLDESVNDMGTAYNNPFKIEFKDSYSADDIKNAINKLLEIYPVLSARVINEDEALSFSFDGDVEVSQGMENDIPSFIRPFDFEKSLSRFLIVDDVESISLCMDCHHLIFDGTSANVLLDSLLSILEGKGIDSIDTGILREISYEENISSDYMEKASLFFDSMLEDVDEVYELLPSVKAEESSDFEYIDVFDIDKNDLSSFLEKASITHNQFFTSAFAYALSKFSASSKVSFNLIEDGRGHIDLSESVGMFVRTLPLIIDCENQEVLSFLDYSSGIISSAMKYDLYPFRLLANEYDLSSDILFQYSHDLLYSLMSEDDLPYKVEDLKQDVMGDLSFFVFNEEGDRLGIKILYSQKFSNDFIRSFAESYKLILKDMMKVDELSDINYVLSSDLDILDSYNQTEKDLDYDDILDAFNDHLSKYPNNPLVSYNDVSYSYAEGAFIADGIAKSLKGIGISPQDNIAFILERSELYMFSALAILSIGAVYVPIDDALPDERIRFMLNDTDAKAVIVSKSTYDRAKNLIGDEKILLDISDVIKGESGVHSSSSIKGESDNHSSSVADEFKSATLSHLPVIYGDLACILYTSGTTGIPKGVQITRKGITSYVDFYVNEYNMKYGSKFGMFSSIGFDVGAIRAICGPLYGGSCMDIVPMDIRLDIEKLNQHFISHGVTHTTLPTQVARIFIDEVKDTSLKVLITGGEKLGQVNANPDYSFIDSYGPTEACVAVCAIEEKDKIDSSSIGHLFTNLKAYVLDDELRRVPIGAVGELHIAGDQVAKGYLNRNEETTKAFMENPYEMDDDYGILYRTGDLVRVLPDGSLGIVGRRDSQVKVRGNRVELMEVEALIREMDSIEAVTVQAIEHNGNNELVAYVVSDDEDIGESLLSYVSCQKPDYMVPSFVVKLDKIPLTVNGKVDRRALPEVDRSNLHAGYIAPRNEKERIIVKAFENVFNQENIGIHDDFIHLGGDSLIAIKLLSHLEDYDITAADILSFRTPEAIAKRIDEFSLDLDIYTLEGGCPLNEAQINLFLDSIMNKTDFYHIPTFMSIPKEYSLQKVLDALNEILRVHPILAMHVSDYYEGDEEKNFFDRIRDDVDLLNDLKDLGDSFSDQSLVDLLKSNGWNIKSIFDMVRIAAKAFRGEYPYLITGAKPPVTVESGFSEDIIKNFLSQGFDLYDYLSMFEVLDLEDSYIVLAKFHHIIFDGMCVNTFKRDLQILLDGGTLDVDDSFLKMAAFHRQIKGTEKFDEAKDFFDSMYGNVDEVRGLQPDNHSKGYGIKTYDLEFDSMALKSFLDNSGLSENLFFTGIFAYALSRFERSENVLFSMIDNGRGRFDDYDAIGLYANISTLLINCSNQSIGSFFNHASDVVYGAIKYDYYPLILTFKDYPIDASVIFQFIPDWISYDVIDGESSIFSSDFMDDFIGGLLGNMDELLAEFIVQIFRNGDNYSVLIVNANKYSDKMVEEFKDILESILSKVVHEDLSSDLKDI